MDLFFTLTTILNAVIIRLKEILHQSNSNGYEEFTIS